MTVLRWTVALGLLALLGPGCNGGSKPQWDMVLEDLDAGLLSVWGSSADDIWVVGADPGDGPLVLHYDGSGWSRLDTGASGDLWWVFGTGDSVWMSGEAGLIVRYSRSSGEFDQMQAPGATETTTLFGIFPVSEDDVWSVGGDIGMNEGVVYRYDGTEWSEVTDVPEEATGAGLFKVWGRSSDDLWIVGLGDVALHRDPEGWNVLPVPTGRRLLTVHGNTDRTVAVGGFGSGLVVENEDDALVEVTPDGIPQLNGVWVAPEGDVVAVGTAGAIWTHSEAGWEKRTDTPPTSFDYHAVFVDPAGGEWAVGGQIVSEPFTDGMLAYRGEADIPSTIDNL